MGTWLDPIWKQGVGSDLTNEGIRSAVVLIHLKDHIDYFQKITPVENTG